MTSGQPPGSFGHQRVLAHTAIFVDLFIDGRIGVSPVWGPLVPFMEGHLVAVEFVSDWLSKKMLIRYIAAAQLQPRETLRKNEDRRRIARGWVVGS